MNAMVESAGASIAMAKPKGRPAISERDDVTVRLDRQVAAKLRYVAEARGISLAEILTEFLRPIADREFDRITKAK